MRISYSETVYGLHITVCTAAAVYHISCSAVYSIGYSFV